MRTASQVRAHSVSRAASTAPARRSHKPVEPTKEEFLEQLTPDLRKTVEALQKLYRKK